MTINELSQMITKAEGKKHQASMGDVKEILAILSDMLSAEVVLCLYTNGMRRAKKNKTNARRKR